MIVCVFTTADNTLFTGWGHNQCRRQAISDWYVYLTAFPALPHFQFFVTNGDGMAVDMANMQC